jgi:hypothetical protein
MPKWPQTPRIGAEAVAAEVFMAEIVNLRTARKRAKRVTAEEQAAARRLAHGRSKAERNLERAQSDKDRRSLDHHRIESGDE